MVTLKEAKKYYLKGSDPIDETIEQALRGDDEIVYGARATNKVFPEYLDKHTEDWDIATNDDPKQVANKIEKMLDKRYGGNYFYVEPAKHEGTFKIKSKVTRSGVVDVSIIEDPISHERIGGINYATLDNQVKNIEKSLSDPESKFRHDKDKETLQRIKIYEREHPKGTLNLGMHIGPSERILPSRKKMPRGDPFGMSGMVFPGINSSRGR